MIAKGNLHGDGGALARYLMTGKNGEVAELLQTRGLENLGGDPEQAFATLQKVAEANTKSAMPFFHAQTRLPHGENLTDAQLLQVADREEKRLGFTGQPRIASVHILPNGDKHLHVGWFRIDLETMQAKDPGMYKNHLKQLCRKLEKEFCLQEVSNFRKPEDLARAASWKEQEEARRLGTDERAIRSTILDCLEHADGGKALRAALDERGLMLANGDKRDCFVVVDQAGGHHALNKKLTGHTLAETRDRLADLDRTQLPSVEQAQEIQRTRTAERDRAAEIDRAAHAEARGKYDSLHETERKVSRHQFPGRYDDLRAAEPPPEVVRDFETNANRAAEPVAPIYDRDADNTAWEEKLAENAINAEAQKGHEEPGAGREARAGGPEPSGGMQQRPEPEDMRPLGKTAGEIRAAWTLSSSEQQLEEALAARGITLAQVSPEEARQSQRTAAFAKEVGNFARVWKEGEIVAVNSHGDIHRLDQRTTGDLRPEIEARLSGIDRAGLLSVTDAKEVMQEASRAAWRGERQAEREQARPASAIETAIADALTTTMTGTDFAAALDKAGITITRADERDVNALDALRQDAALAGIVAQTEGEPITARHYATLLPGDFAAVNQQGDVFRLSPQKLDLEDIEQRLADTQTRMPSVVEARAHNEIKREATADFWAELRARYAEDRSVRNDAYEGDRALHGTVNAGERGVENTLRAADSAVNAGLDAASGALGGFAKAVERVLGGIISFFVGEPKLTRQQQHDHVRAETNEETLHARAYAAHEQAKEADQDWRIFEQNRQQQQEDFAARYGAPGGSSGRDRERDDDYDGGYERER
jgi:Relaxase/Mobilisation nuclease domain